MSRTIAGIVDEDGNILSGEGFKCHGYGGSGIYVIEYDQPFQKPPVVVSNVAGPEWQTFNLSTSVIENVEFISVICTSGPDRPVRSSFHFIAIGD